MSTSARYGLIGVLAGLLAPAALFVYGAATLQMLDPIRLSIALATGGVVVFACVGRMIGRRDEILLARNITLAALSEELRALSTTDALTGIPNRRSFDERLAMELARTRRYGVPCALVMVDLDRFKAANDRHGHRAGDAILRHVASLLDAQKRTGDLVARYGGEELAAILPHTSAADARAWAERARTRIEREPTPWFDGAVRMTASFGVAAAPPEEKNTAALIEAADRALYAAKRHGRNRVVVAQHLPDVDLHDVAPRSASGGRA